MKRHELAQFFRWSLYGAVVGLGVVGTQLAIAQVTVPRPGGSNLVTTLGGARILRAELKNNGQQENAVVVLSRADGTSGNFHGTLSLVQREFKGNMMSRVPRAGDIVDTVLESRAIATSLPVVGEKPINVSFETPSVPKGRVTYIVRLVVDQQACDIAGRGVTQSLAAGTTVLPKLSLNQVATGRQAP